MGSRRATRTRWTWIVLLCLCAPLAAQKKPKLPRWKIDPYTKNEPELMEKLGYVSYGPFEFGQLGRADTGTTQIETQIPYADFLWVETAHFRIGLALDPYPIPTEASTRKKIRSELERLHEILPRVKPKTRRLDPWLRLHLTAMRLEDVYEELKELLDVQDRDFPRSKQDVILGRGRYMGYGPFLGMKNKYLILVTSKTGTYLDYLSTYIGKQAAFGQCWHFKETGSLFYGVATELDDGKLKHDTALHCNLVFNTTHLLIHGFRHYSYDLPVWINEGLAHWFQRRVSPKWNSFTQNEGGLADLRPAWKWRPETRRLLAAGKGASFSDMYTWRDYSQIKFPDHVLMWSRWDYLMTFGQEKFESFMFSVKGRVDPKTWLTDEKDLIGASRNALRKVYGLTPLSFDEKWKQWVLDNYPTQ